MSFKIVFQKGAAKPWKIKDSSGKVVGSSVTKKQAEAIAMKKKKKKRRYIENCA